jgi:hypothetical protein
MILSFEMKGFKGEISNMIFLTKGFMGEICNMTPVVFDKKV